jgi:hypothetical protein
MLPEKNKQNRPPLPYRENPKSSTAQQGTNKEAVNDNNSSSSSSNNNTKEQLYSFQRP